jgi:hypothetical protein
MCLLVISDSHGRDMDDIIASLDSDYQVCVISVGRTTPEIREEYDDTIVDIYEYAPEAVIIHTGHNDITYHCKHNPSPMQPLQYMGEAMAFMDHVKECHRFSEVFYSSIFPRSEGPNFDMLRKIKYNQMAANYRLLVEDICEIENRNFILNDTLWYSVDEGIEHPFYFESGGLHLSGSGKRAIAREWIDAVDAATL